MAEDGKKAFTFFRSYYEAARELPDKQRLAFYDAIVQYGVSGEEATLSGIAKAMFVLVKPTLDKSQAKAEAGSKGGKSKSEAEDKQAPSKSQANPKQSTSKFKADQKQPPSDKSEDKDKDIGLMIKDVLTPLPPRGKTENEKAFAACTETLCKSDLSAEEKAKLAGWLQHKRERKDKYTETGFQALLAEFQKNVAQFGRDAVFRAVDQSMAGGYAGIAWDRLRESAPASRNQPQKTGDSSFDIDELERTLLHSSPRLLD